MTKNTEQFRELSDIKKPLELFKNLKNDLEKLRSQINNFKKTKISSKVLNELNLRKEFIPINNIFEYTGNRISQSLRNVEAKEISKRLFKKPNDSTSRIQLVEMYLREEKDSSLLISRDAFLFIMYELEDTVISSLKINLALKVQKIYLEKLQKFLTNDLKETERKIKGEGNVDHFLEKQHNKLKGEVNFVKKCRNLLQVSSIEVDYELNLAESKDQIPYVDLKNGFDPMLRCLVYLPLAEKNLNLMFDILQRLESKNPMIGYHKSKMHEIYSQIFLVIGTVGKKKEYKKKGFENLAKALQAIISSIRLIGDFPEKSIEKAVVYRFSYLCYSIYGIYNSFGITIPREHFVRIKKALSLLKPIAKDPKFHKIQSKLLYIVSENRPF